MTIKAYLEKKFAQFSHIWPISENASFFERVSCARNELEEIVSMRLIEA
jgi:hypothetical protein